MSVSHDSLSVENIQENNPLNVIGMLMYGYDDQLCHTSQCNKWYTELVFHENTLVLCLLPEPVVSLGCYTALLRPKQLNVSALRQAIITFLQTKQEWCFTPNGSSVSHQTGVVFHAKREWCLLFLCLHSGLCGMQVTSWGLHSCSMMVC